MRSRGKISLSLLQVFCGVRFCLVSMLMVWRRPNAFLSPMEHEAKRKFCATRVKGGNPLRVQGGARESLPSGNPAVRRTPNPTKQAKRLAPLPPDGCCLCTVFACMRNFPVRCISAAVSGAFFLSGIPRCRKRRGENANPRTNFIFCKKQRIFWHVCAGQGRDNGLNAAKERRKTFGRGTGRERCEPEPKPAKSIYKAKMKDAHHKTVKFIQKIENRAP